MTLNDYRTLFPILSQFPINCVHWHCHMWYKWKITVANLLIFFQSPCCECVHRDQSGTYTSDRCCLCLVDKCPCGATKLSDHRVYCSPCNCKCGIIYDEKAHLLVCTPCNCPRGACTDGYGNPYCCKCPPPPAPPPAGGCFPSTSRVTLENGESVTMSELQGGDMVQTGIWKYSETRMHSSGMSLVDRIPACTAQGGCLPRGCVSAWGVSVQGVSGQGGVCLWSGGCIPACNGADPPVGRQTPVKT